MPKPIPLCCPLCDIIPFLRRKKFEEHLCSHGYANIEEAFIIFCLNGIRPSCKCGCGSDVTFKNWHAGFSTFKRGHQTKGIHVPEERKIRIRKNSRGRKPWHAGLSAKDDRRIAKWADQQRNAYRDGRLTAWMTGLTKDTDERLHAASETRKAKIASGEIILWHRGKTIKTDPRLRALIDASTQTRIQRINSGTIIPWNRRSNDVINELLVRNAPNIEILNIEDYVRGQRKNLHFMCKICKFIEMTSLLNIINRGCKNCDSSSISSPHRELNEFIDQLGVEYTINDRNIISPKELDTYIETHKLAIEMNGNFWHSEQSQQYSRLHISEKSSKCAKLGIVLLHIFDDEWYHKQDIVKSMIRHRLHMTKRRLAARACMLKEISQQERKLFFDHNHIDGDTDALHAYALIFDDEIVACISLRRPSDQRYSEYIEIARMCQMLDTIVRGAVSKLIKHVIELHGTSLIAYVDERNGTGDCYESAGFRLIETTAERFWWTNGTQRFDASSFEACDEISKNIVLNDAGMARIYGCCDRVYVFQKQS